MCPTLRFVVGYVCTHQLFHGFCFKQFMRNDNLLTALLNDIGACCTALRGHREALEGGGPVDEAGFS